jgi:hypothetical protein
MVDGSPMIQEKKHIFMWSGQTGCYKLTFWAHFYYVQMTNEVSGSLLIRNKNLWTCRRFQGNSFEGPIPEIKVCPISQNWQACKY